MHWLDGSARNYNGNAVKLVFFVPDAKALIGKIREPRVCRSSARRS